MLLNLFLQNIATAKAVDVDFKKGLSVLTGETGAGKSIIVDAISIIYGSKPSKDLIREGEQKALVSALFGELESRVVTDIKDLGVNISDGDDTLHIQREFNIEGRCINKINGKSISQTLLREVTKLLLNIHNQYDSQALLQSENHIILLDSFSDLDVELTEYQEVYNKMTELKTKISSFSRDEKEKQRTMELLKYQINDIEKAKLREKEEEKLEELKRYVQNIEKITQNINIITSALTDSEEGFSAVEQIKRAISALNNCRTYGLDKYIPHAEEYMERLEHMESEILDISEFVKSSNSLQDDENPTARLDKIEKRLDRISKLKKKYGSSIEEILKYKNKISDDLDNIIFSDEKTEQLQKELKDVERETVKKAEKLTEKRNKAKYILEEKIMNELSYLEMEKVIFDINVKKIENSTNVYTSRGCDKVEFLIATNTGDSLKPLNKIVSGGELSRVMLALKSVFAVRDNVQTIIFDEIDTGISGKTAHKIGEKLKAIANYMQVICVTHSAQIAALSDNHYLIKKEEVDGRAVSDIKELEHEEKIKEVARIMGGVKISDTLIKTAMEMVNNNKKNRRKNKNEFN